MRSGNVYTPPFIPAVWYCFTWRKHLWWFNVTCSNKTYKDLHV